MMCGEIEKLLPAYQDGVLPLEKMAVVRTHLESCLQCKQEDQLLGLTWTLLGEAPVLSPSPTFRARFWERVRKEDEKIPWWRELLRVRWAPVTVGLLAIWTVGVMGGWLFFKGQAGVKPKYSDIAISRFSSFYPPNSIEEIYLAGEANSDRRSQKS